MGSPWTFLLQAILLHTVCADDLQQDLHVYRALEKPSKLKEDNRVSNRNLTDEDKLADTAYWLWRTQPPKDPVQASELAQTRLKNSAPYITSPAPSPTPAPIPSPSPYPSPPSVPTTTPSSDPALEQANEGKGVLQIFIVVLVIFLPLACFCWYRRRTLRREEARRSFVEEMSDNFT